MINGLYRNVNILEKALDASWLRNEAISNNIANIDTPNYKRQVVEFEDFLSDALDNKKLKIKTTNENHITNSNDLNEIKIQVRKDYEQNNMRTDGNNVDIDREMALISKNNIYYQVISQQIKNKINKIKNTLRDVK